MSVVRELFAYRKGKSFFHSIDPLTKLIFVVGIGFASTFANAAIPNIIFFIVLIIAIFWLAKTPMQRFLTGLRVFGIFAGGMFLVQVHFAYTSSGELLWQLGPLRATTASIDFSLAVALRFLTLALSAMLYTTTTTARDAAFALIQKLRIPYRIGYMLFLIMRYLPLFETDLQAIQDAHKVRGVGEKTGFRGQIENIKRYTIPLLIEELNRARIAAITMETRAFGAYPTRTFIKKIRISIRAKIFAVVSIIFFITVIVLAMKYLYMWQPGQYAPRLPGA